MTLSSPEIEVIVKGASDDAFSGRARALNDIRRLLGVLPSFEFRATKATPLARLCAAGMQFGWRELERNLPAKSLVRLSARARASLRRNLQRDLEWLTRPCFELERTSFGLAVASLAPPGKSDPKSLEEMFLGGRPSHRLFSLFRKFPVLALLWCQLIRQWRMHVKEVLLRFEKDRRSLSRTFFANRSAGKIVDTHFGLSDRHHSGRTVVRLQFDAGSIIYKPRSGVGEMEWFSLLAWINRRGFQPGLRPARVLPRKGYCWMEFVAAASLKNKPAARRFYQRLGGIIAAAHLLKAVDCHRDNLIASGEHPVLVDADALWHVSPATETQTPADLLYRTGFFPNANPRSLQSRSSALGSGTGNHLPRLNGKPRAATQYQREIAGGFAQAWRCILGTSRARGTFARQLQRIRSNERRWFYWATETYAAIKDASIQPEALRSARNRELLIRRRCARDSVASGVIDAEVRSLQQLDIPYFLARTDQPLAADRSTVPQELVEALGAALLNVPDRRASSSK
jgi:Domain of unknown function (DUF4135)